MTRVTEFNTGTLMCLEVYKDDVLVGTGYVICQLDYWHTPVLTALDGTELPSNWYTLRATEQHLVCWNDTMH